jgi:hypothetical protein
MDRRPTQESSEGREAVLTAEEIELLMRGPVKDWPSIIIMGDEDVVGFNPPRPPSAPREPDADRQAG